MKLQCSVLVVVLVGVLCMGGGFAIGKATQPITINNISHSESTSISSSASMSGSILVQNDKKIDVIKLNISGVTNLTIVDVTNGVTNIRKMKK